MKWSNLQQERIESEVKTSKSQRSKPKAKFKISDIKKMTHEQYEEYVSKSW